MNDKQWNEIKSSVVSWGKVGDFIEGTLTDIRVREVKDDKKGLIRKNIYEIKADAGQFHEIDDKKNPIEPAIDCGTGDYYIIWGGKESIDNGFRKTKIGQKVKVMFSEEFEPKTKGYSGFKLIKVYIGVMDTEWLESEEAMTKDIV